MNKNETNYNTDYINNLIQHLNPPAKNEIKSSPLSSKILDIGDNLAQELDRSKGKYSEANARQLVIDYINNPECTKTLQPQHKKIVEIYHRLTQLSTGTGTWADGIDQELLYAHEPHELLSEKQEPQVLDLEEMIKDNVFVPDAPEEKIFYKETKTPQTAINHSANTYTFTPSKFGMTIPTNKMLFHIHADEFGSSSELEGSQANVALNYLRSYLIAHSSAQSPYSDELMDELFSILQIQSKDDKDNVPSPQIEQSHIQKAQEKIGAAFESGKPLMLTGGWAGKPGHAIYYEILPDSNNSASFRLYNTGAGVKYHSSVQEGHKLKYQSYLEWKGIDRQNLESPLFLQVLYELNSYTSHNFSNTNYGEDDIYLGLKRVLDPKEEHEKGLEADKHHFRGAQRAGICAWKSLMAFMRTKMDVMDYKRFKCDIKLQSLKDFTEAYSQKVSVEDWRLVQKCHQNLCRGILKLYKDNLVGDDYIQTAQGILKPISEWIHKNSDCRFRQFNGSVEFKYAAPVEDQILENKLSSEVNLHDIQTSASVENTSVQPWQIKIEDFNLGLDQPAAIESSLHTIKSLSQQAWLAGEDIALHRGLINSISNLPLDAAFWNKAIEAQPEKAERLITLLGDLAQYFLKSCFTISEAHLFFSNKIYVMDKILFLQELLCQARQPNSHMKPISLFSGVNLRANSYGTGTVFISYPEARMLDDVHTMLNTLQMYGSYHLENIKRIENMGLQIEFKKNPFLWKFTFENLIRTEYPNIIEKMMQEDPHFKDLPDVSQYAHIYMSPHLPEWIKALRDAELGSLFMRHAYFGALASLDRHSDIQPMFRVVDKEETSEVTINLKGVTSEILNIPEVKKMEKEDLRYTGQYPEIQSTALQQLLTFLKNWDSPEKEKEWLSLQTKDLQLNLSDEECRELVRWLLPSNFQHIEAIEYFTKHPVKLKETDYQTFLQIILFKPSLKENLNIAGFPELLEQFIQKKYEFFLEQNAIQTSVFLLKIAHQLHSFCPDLPFFAQAHEHLNTLLMRKGLDVDDKVVINTELLAQLSRKQTLNEKEIISLVAGGIYLEENTRHCRIPLDPVARNDAREALIIHAQKIKENLEQGKPNQKLLNTLFKLARPDSTIKDLSWTQHSSPHEFPFFSSKDGEYILYPLISRLISPKTQVSLPLAIRQHPLFHELFPDIEQGSIQAGNLYSFKDPHGKDTLVQMKDNHLVIEQRMKLNGQEAWFRFIPPALFLQDDAQGTVQPLAGSRHLIHHYHHWQSLDTNNAKQLKIYALEKNSGQPKYLFSGTIMSADEAQNERLSVQIEKLREKYINELGFIPEIVFQSEIEQLKKKGKIQGIKAPANSSYFKLHEIQELSGPSKLGKPSSLLTHFEDPAYIQEWYTSEGVLQKIELPRFQLSFKPDPQSPKKLICEQYPQYFLNTTHAIKELGTYPHYLVLQDVNGMRKVLLPQQTFKSPEKKEVLLPRFVPNRQLERDKLDPQKAWVFDVQKNGKLFNKSREANLYLAQVLAISQEYGLAAEYLQKFGEKLSVSAYSTEEAQLLKELSNMTNITGDASGNIIAIQLYADFLGAKNTLSRGHELSKLDRETLRQHYDLYLNHYRHATALKLKKHEEIFVLKTLLSEKFDASHFLRLKELYPEAALNLTVPAAGKADIIKNEPSTALADFDDFIQFNEAPRNLSDHILITRPQESMQKDFVSYYNQFYDGANKGTPEDKQRCQQILIFLRTAENGKYKGLADLFEAVLENPNDFPKPLEKKFLNINEQKAQIKWKKELKEAAKRQIDKKPAISSSFKVNLEDITPPGFQLDDKIEPLAPLKITPSLPTLSTLAAEIEAAGSFEPLPTKDNTQTHEALSALLTSSMQNENTNSLQDKEIFRLRQDLEKFKIQAPQANYRLKDKGLNKIFIVLSQDKFKDREEMQSLEWGILSLANKSPSSPEALALTQIQTWGELHKVITLEELFVCFTQNDYAALLQKNPSLQEHEIRMLADKIGSFLWVAARHQQRVRAEAILNKIEDLTVQAKSQTPEYQDLVNQLAQELLAKREFDPLKHPSYLVFEYYANISMRAAQVEKLEKFLKEKDLNLVMEMIMGSGKSKVLLPLLGLMQADGKALSMLIVPQQLFESISQDTKSSLQGAFSQALRALHFDRHSPFTQEFLEGILDDLEHIKKHKECLIMTNKSVQCLILKFITESAQHFSGSNKDKEFSRELKTLQKILNVLSTSGYPIIDEADTVLNVLHEINFSGGKRLSPPIHEMELISELYSLVYEDPLLKKLARIESNPDADKASPILTETLYFDKIQRPLAEAFIQKAGNMKFESKTLSDKMSNFIKDLKDTDRSLLLQYLCRDKTHMPEAQSYFDSLDEDIQDILALAGEQISHLLPYTLTRLCDEKYGLDIKSGGLLAIPFSAANTPNSGSQFSNPHITMNFTFQTYMKKGISRDMIERQIKLLQEKAVREVSGSGGKLQIKDTEAGKLFALLKGNVDMPLFNYKPVNIYELVAHVNANPAAKREFVTQIVLPQMELFENKVSCNPHNLVGLFTNMSGFTGTLWNGLSMHHSLNPEPEVGIDAKTLALLWENSPHTTVTLKEGSTDEMLKQLNEKSISFDMLCDAGGYFKEGDNKEIAHKIAAINSKETVYYNFEGEQTLTDATADIPIAESNKAENERLTFLDQIHTTGADVPQKWNAVSLVTIGRNMLLRDLLQSVWRLRGLNKSQQVRFAISEEVAGIIRQKLGLKDSHPIEFEAILKFAIANQAAQQGIDNYKAIKQEFANIPQVILLNVLMKENLSIKARAQAFHYLQSTWIKPAVFRAKDLYGSLAKDQISQKVLETDTKQCKDMIQEMFSKMPWLEQMGLSQKFYLQEVETLANRIKGSLPATLKTPSKEIEDGQTVEVERAGETEKQTHKETEAQREVKTSSQSDRIKLAFIILQNKYQINALQTYPSFIEALKALKKATQVIENKFAYGIELDNYPIFPLKSYMHSDRADKFLKPYVSAFEGINVSLNILEWTLTSKQYALLGSRRTDFHHLLIKDNTVTLITQEEAQTYRSSPDYYNLTLGYNDPQKKPTQDQLLKIVKLKFLNGESQYSNEEIHLLKLWFKVQGKSKMQKLFLEAIISGYPNKAMSYQNSPLQKLFNTLQAL